MGKTSFKIYALIGFGILILIANSCKIGKKYTRPELDMPETIEEGSLESLTMRNKASPMPIAGQRSSA